jgi:hypothetical protein
MDDSLGLGAAGPVLVSKEHPLKFRDPSIKAIAEQITRDELAHVHVLRRFDASKPSNEVVFPVLLSAILAATPG